METSVTILDYSELHAFKEQIKLRRQPSAENGYELWKKYDTAIREVLKKYGKVGWDEDANFYHGGDWFHELYNGFALRTSTSLSIKILKELQQVVSSFHRDAILEFGGELGTSISGLKILVSSSGLFAAWYGDNAAECRRKLEETGIKIL